MNLLIKNGRLMDPVAQTAKQGDLPIIEGKIASAEQARNHRFAEAETIDAQGCWVLPGLVDLSVHLKTRGVDPQQVQVHDEVMACLAGGITSVVLPPDTVPILDELSLVEMLMNRNRLFRHLGVYPLGAMTVGFRGEEITEMAAMHKAGCIGFSHAAHPLPDLAMLRSCMQYAQSFGFSLWLSPRDASLGQGVAATGAMASRLGLKDVPEQAETIALQAIFELLRSDPVPVHLCRLSSARSVELVAQAKREGLPVTADVSINHLLLTDVDIGYFNADYRLNPPLRSDRDRSGIGQGVLDGVIDAVCSDHTPIDSEHKILPFAEAVPGAVGAELLLSLLYKWSEHDQSRFLEALPAVTSKPASIIRQSAPRATLNASLSPGSHADLVIFDPHASWVVSADNLHSGSSHTPFAAYELPGRVLKTIVGGRLSWQLS